MFYAVDKARVLAAHTIRITANPKIFQPEYDRMTAKIVATAVGIYECAWTANNVLVKQKSDWDLRRKYQIEACARCNALLALIDLAKSVYKLRDKKVKFWAKLTIETRNLLRSWHNSDQERYGKKYC